MIEIVNKSDVNNNVLYQGDSSMFIVWIDSGDVYVHSRYNYESEANNKVTELNFVGLHAWVEKG